MTTVPPETSREGGRGPAEEERNVDDLTLQVLLGLAVGWMVLFVAVALFGATIPRALQALAFSPTFLLFVVVGLVVLGTVFVPPIARFIGRICRWLRTPGSNETHRNVLTGPIMGVSVACVFAVLVLVAAFVHGCWGK